MKAEILAIGSELLGPSRVDTNSLTIADRLNQIGIEIRAKSIVGDNRHDLALIFRQVLDRADLVLLTGGLGPTEDDVTREVVAEVLALSLVEDPDVTERIRARFARRGWSMPEINRRQAMIPRGAVALDNPLGTAPGLWIEHGDKLIVLLPGPPHELIPMLDELVRGRLASRAGALRLSRRVLRITGRTESHVEEVAQPIYSRWAESVPPVTTTILAALGQIELHLTCCSEDAARATGALDRMTAELQGALGLNLYSTDGRTLEQVIGALLRARGLRLAVAESCTGGLVTSRLTDVPGSSAYVERGLVAYSNAAKIDWLSVPAATLATYGAVSEPVAEAMASGIRARAQVDLGIGITGVAGPGGGSPEKPVGTVAIAVVSTTAARARTLVFAGQREQVKFQASQAALDMVRRLLLDA